MKKENIKVYKFAFWALIIFAIYSIINIFTSHFYEISIPGFNYPIETIKTNVVMNKKVLDNFFICYNDYCKSLIGDDFYNVYSDEFSSYDKEFSKKTVKNIYILYPMQYSNILNNVSIFVGNKKYYYTNDDILKLETKDIDLKLDNQEKEIKLKSVVFPNINNYKGILNHLIILILSLFSRALIYIIPYFWLIVAYLIWRFKLKDEYKIEKINLNYPILLGVIFALGIIFRLNEINYYPLWLDEIYVKTVALKNFVSCFSDAGNPPVFYILEYIVSKISNSDLILRLLPFVFGSLFPFLTYFVFKRFGKNLALFGAFFASFNLISIYNSQDIRSYSLCMLLCLILTYYLFEYIKNPNKKNLVLYSIFSIVAINTHYYFAFLLFGNFLWVIANLIDDKKEVKKFIVSNLIALISFIPYLIISYKTALNATFNSRIASIGKNTFIYIINQYFLNKYIFLCICLIVLGFIVVYFLPNKIRQNLSEKYKEKEDFLIYLIYSIIVILILASLVSIFIKPILHKRILLSVYSLLFLGEVALISIFYDFKLRILPLIMMFVFFAMSRPMTMKEQYRFDDFMFFVQNDINQYSKDYDIHCITNDRYDYLYEYPDVEQNKNIIWHFVDTNAMKHINRISKKDYLKDNKNAVIYLHDMSANINKVGFLNPNMFIYDTNSIRIGKIVYKGEKK